VVVPSRSVGGRAVRARASSTGLTGLRVRICSW
jgi:hypothetical protein